jgi:hypothetical protein
MPARHPSPPSRLLPPIAPATEWVGGRFLTPFFIEEEGPYRAEADVWLELPAGLIVATRLLGPNPAALPFSSSYLNIRHALTLGRRLALGWLGIVGIGAE